VGLVSYAASILRVKWRRCRQQDHL